MTLDLGAVSRSAVVGDHWVSARPLLWFTAFLVAGAACLANAARCGRRHCYFTGPLFLLAAAYNALSEFHLVPMHETFFLWIDGRCVGCPFARVFSRQIPRSNLGCVLILLLMVGTRDGRLGGIDESFFLLSKFRRLFPKHDPFYTQGQLGWRQSCGCPPNTLRHDAPTSALHLLRCKSHPKVRPARIVSKRRWICRL